MKTLKKTENMELSVDKMDDGVKIYNLFLSDKGIRLMFFEEEMNELKKIFK